MGKPNGYLPYEMFSNSLISNVFKAFKMIEEPKLLRINPNTPRPSGKQINALRKVPTGVANDAMWGKGAFSKNINHIDPYGSIAKHAIGPALTVDAGPGDILALLASFKFIKSGDIVISAFGAYQGCAAAGDRVSGMMKNCGAAGFITDGPMRDLSGLGVQSRHLVDRI